MRLPCRTAACSTSDSQEPKSCSSNASLPVCGHWQSADQLRFCDQLCSLLPFRAHPFRISIRSACFRYVRSAEYICTYISYKPSFPAFPLHFLVFLFALLQLLLSFSLLFFSFLLYSPFSLLLSFIGSSFSLSTFLSLLFFALYLASTGILRFLSSICPRLRDKFSLLTNLRTCGHGAVFSCIVLAIAHRFGPMGIRTRGYAIAQVDD